MNGNAPPLEAPGTLALLTLVLSTGCGFLPEPPSSYGLAPEWSELLSQDPTLEAQALEIMDEVFGTPQAPRLPLLAEWSERGFDPNRPSLAEGHGGSGELTSDQIDEIRRANRDRFEDELEDLERGQADEIEHLGPWDAAPDLTRRWDELLAAPTESPDLLDRARTLLADHYPSLGESARLYTQRCLTCHGNEGGGDGPGSRFLTPRPRDFRRGVFKFTARAEDVPPKRSDVVRILRDGIQHTSMPSFSYLTDAELHGLADYVRFLAVRGESELWWIDDVEPGEPLERADLVEAFSGVFEDWWSTESVEVPLGDGPPVVTAERLELGRDLFHDAARGNCASCHGAEGKGLDEEALNDRRARGDQAVDIDEFRDAWGDLIKPRDLARGPFRYGDEPEDVFRRIYAGINGTPMPGVGDIQDASGESVFGQPELWALTLYVMSLRDGTAPALSTSTRAQAPGSRSR